MAPRDDLGPDHLGKVQRTRAGRLWLMLVPALAFLILLIVFIAENGQRVEVKFFGASGHISLAVALLIAAVSGAVLVLLIGGIRILQLRLATLRHRRSERHAAKGGSAPASSGEAKPVQSERHPDATRP
jgi:uncharacterized integral membrane protein